MNHTKQLHPRAVCLQHVQARHNQQGLTLVELMVAMAISLVIALAAVAALTVARRGFTTVDASSQLRDNARFASDIVQRMGVQAGYQDVSAAMGERKIEKGVSTNPTPFVTGLNNRSRNTTDDTNVGTVRTTADGSDILVLRFQAAETFPGSGVLDRSMLNCLGGSEAIASTSRDYRMVTMLHVADSQGEPSLMCTSTTTDILTGAETTPNNASTQPLVRGVENFQVLYGVDGSTAAEPAQADRFLRADEIMAAGTPLQVNNLWRRVRSIRIGMVVRGPAGSSQDQNTQTFFPFGPARLSATGTPGSAFVSANDPGTSFTPAVDGRLRQSFTFTIHLRNFQDQCATATLGTSICS